MGDRLSHRRQKSQARNANDEFADRFQGLVGIFEPFRRFSRGRLTMCTLTFVPTEDGYVAGMNRDEKRARPAAFFPQRFEFPGSDAIYPHEASGGTWIACNTYGNLLALLNWNDVRLHSMPAGQLSRGALIPELLPAANDLAHVS